MEHLIDTGQVMTWSAADHGKIKQANAVANAIIPGLSVTE